MSADLPIPASVEVIYKKTTTISRFLTGALSLLYIKVAKLSAMADPSRLFAPSSEYVIEYDDFVLRLTASSDENTRTHAPKLELGIDENSKNRTVLVFGALDYTNMQIEFEARGSKGYTLERVALKHNRNKINETEKEITEIEELDIPEITTVDPSKNRQVHLTCDVDSNRGKYSGW